MTTAHTSKKIPRPHEIPIGISEFPEIRQEGYYFIDKSFFIKDFIENITKAGLITRPRRFGKSTNMSMLAAFFDCDTLEYGPLFDDLEIAKDTDFCDQFMSQYPVIFLSFKDVAYESKEEFLADMRNLVSMYLKKVKYLFSSEKIDEQQKHTLSLLENKTASASDIRNCLLFLTTVLHQHHQKPVILLIDEYDTPINSARKNKLYDECIDFMRVFLGAGFKGNSHLFKGLLTGVLRVSREGLFSTLNSLEVATVTSNLFSDAFGITQNELDKILKDFSLSQYKDNLASWYNGYQIGDTTSIYNPWSILRWLKDPDHAWVPYWVNTASPDILSELFLNNAAEVKNSVLELLMQTPIKLTVQEHIILPQLDVECSANEFLNLLWHAGYITPTHKEFINDQYYYDMRIPNTEIRMIFQNLVTDWLRRIKLNLGIQDTRPILEALRAGNVEEFGNHINYLITHVMSYHDFAKTSENSFHCLLAGFLSWLKPTYGVTSNREAGHGRFDILMTSQDKDVPSYVFEIKAWDKPKEPSKKQIEDTLNTALLQIKKRNYSAIVNQQHTAGCINVGFLFHKKKMWLKWEVA